MQAIILKPYAKMPHRQKNSGLQYICKECKRFDFQHWPQNTYNMWEPLSLKNKFVFEVNTHSSSASFKNKFHTVAWGSDSKEKRWMSYAPWWSSSFVISRSVRSSSWKIIQTPAMGNVI